MAHGGYDKIEEFPDEGRSEMTVTFDPDFSPEENVDDIESYLDVLNEMRGVFMDRRRQYGNHLENAERFPQEHPGCLYAKCARAIRNHDAGQEYKKDTLIDLANFAVLILSHRKWRGRDDTTNNSNI